MRWGDWPSFGVGTPAVDIASAQSAIAQLQGILTGADGQVAAGTFDGAVSAYKTAGTLAVNVVLPAIVAAGGDYAVTSSSYGPSFAAAQTFLTADNAALQAVPVSTTAGQAVATLNDAMTAQNLAYGLLDQSNAMMGFVQALAGGASSGGAATKGHWVMPAIAMFVGSIGAAMVWSHVERR